MGFMGNFKWPHLVSEVPLRRVMELLLVQLCPRLLAHELALRLLARAVQHRHLHTREPKNSESPADRSKYEYLRRDG